MNDAPNASSTGLAALRHQIASAIDSPTVAALANVFSPRNNSLAKSYSEQITDILLPRLEALQSSDGSEVADGAIGSPGLTEAPRKCQPSRPEGETTRPAGVAPGPSEAILGAAQAPWQPLNTAPILENEWDEAPSVMLWVADGGGKGSGCHAFGRVYRYADGTTRAVASGFAGNWNITRWMPLPAAPSVPSTHRARPIPETEEEAEEAKLK